MKKKHPGGRPPRFDEQKLHELKQLMRLNPTLNDTAAFFDVHPETIIKTVKRNWGIEFVEFREQNMVHTRLSLVRKAIQEATKERPNTAMLIFALKNLCKWKDRFDDPSQGISEDEKKIYLAYEIKPKAVVDANKQLDT